MMSQKGLIMIKSSGGRVNKKSLTLKGTSLVNSSHNTIL